MWARVHKIDKVKSGPKGAPIVILEDERNAGAMSRVPSLSTLVAIARILNAKRLLDMKYAGAGEIRYATNARLPSFLSEAISRAGANITDRGGDTVEVPAMPASVDSVIDLAFNELANYTRNANGATDMSMALKTIEARRRKAPLDREADPAAYWTAIFELGALAGELSRPKNGRWFHTDTQPAPFAIKLAEGGIATPLKLAQQIVEGANPLETMVTETLAP
jgi:hypothetical protein